MEFKEFVEKKHWYSSFWADVVWVLLGVLALLFIFGTQYATGEFGFSISKMFAKKTEAIPVSQPIAKVEIPPKVVLISPASGDPNVKIDSEIKISFDKTTTGYDVNFIVEPFSNFDISFDEARKDFTIAPKGNLDFARDYAVSVKLASSSAKLSAAQMPEAFRANFKTEPPPPPPPAPVEEVVLPEDKAAGIIADSQVASPEAKIAEGKYIDLNLAKQQLSIFENGERLGTYKVSTGKRGMATPTGTFKVMAKRGRAWSKKYNLYMPYFMQFTGQGHGIHELPEWKSGYKEGANHLGTPVSHGCVRLGVGPAAKVYVWSDVGTPIVIHY
jgi:lipoprotein-anchoring transpeptidase ErfK/SrfK